MEHLLRESARAAMQPSGSLVPDSTAAKLLDLWNRSDDELRALLKGSAMKRAGVKRLRRNLAVALGNSGEPWPLPRSLSAPRSPQPADPLVAEHVAWAVDKLDG